MGDGRKRFALILTLTGAAALLVVSFYSHAQLSGGDDAARKLQNEDLSTRLARMEESLKSLSAASPALELAQQIERLRQELTQLRGQIEVLGNDVQMTAKRQRDMYVDLDTRMKRLEQPAAAATPPAPQPASAGASVPTTAAAAVPTTAAAAVPATVAAATASATTAAVPASEAEGRAYEAAQGQRKVGNYQGAIAGFRNFIAQYPKSPLAHRAQYWIGDSYYNLREFKSAIASQQRLISAYPDSPSVPDALLNIASSQNELGDAPGARKTLEKLVARYPTSDAAEKAKRRLATLK